MNQPVKPVQFGVNFSLNGKQLRMLIDAVVGRCVSRDELDSMNRNDWIAILSAINHGRDFEQLMSHRSKDICQKLDSLRVEMI
tara:strand:- start:456 stop:704 length:249 start_codon:yes stop_codon:yes gene_type:complete